MRIVHALYGNRAEALRVVAALERHGIKSDNIAIVSGEPWRPAAEGAEIGADLGAIAGGAGGLLAGLGMITVPGLGPLVAAGWLVPAALGFVAGASAGMALGGFGSALMSAGVSAEDAARCEEALRRGASLVTARVRNEDVLVAEHALDEAPRVDPAALLAADADGRKPDGENFTT